MTRGIAAACGLVLCLTGGSALADDADVVRRWTFDEPAGAALTDALHEGAPEGAAGEWDAGHEASAMTGDGAYRIRRGVGGVANAFAELPDDVADADGPVAAVYELRGWTLNGPTAKETLRLGFVHQTHDTSPHVVAQFKVARTAADEVTVTIEAFGDGSTNPDVSLTLPAKQDEPVRLTLTLDPRTRTYRGWCRVGDGEATALGEGKASPGRQPRYLRLGAAGTFDSNDDESVDIDTAAVIRGETQPS